MYFDVVQFRQALWAPVKLKTDLSIQLISDLLSLLVTCSRLCVEVCVVYVYV